MKHTEDRHPPVILANVNNLIQELQQQAGCCRTVERKPTGICPSASSRQNCEQESAKTLGELGSQAIISISF